ncbi:hypothetical protein D3C76_886060 [compost metagenome]
MEGRHAEVEDLRHGQHRALGHLGEVGHAQGVGDAGADHHGQEDRQARDGGAAQLAQQQHYHQGDGSQADVRGAAEVRRLAVAAHGPACGHRHQRQADGGDDHASDQRREEPGDAREDGCDQQADDRRGHDGPQHRGNATTLVTGSENREHGRHAGEGYALHQRQLAAEEGKAEGLQQSGQTAGEQRSGDQGADLGRRQAGGLAEDQRHGDDAAIHGQNVLQAVRQVGADTEVLVFRTLSGGRYS